MWSKETRKWEFPQHETLQEAVKRFFEILDTKEESFMSGREFSPVRMDFEDRKISSCRVTLTAELEDLLPQMKALANK